MLHITDMSWGRVGHPSEIVKIGDEIDVKILDFDKNAMKVSLGYKQTNENPWESIDEKYPEGSVVKGKVVNIMPYGVFVELENGIEGLIHISEFSWSKKFGHPSEKFSVGDAVEAMVLHANAFVAAVIDHVSSVAVVGPVDVLAAVLVSPELHELGDVHHGPDRGPGLPAPLIAVGDNRVIGAVDVHHGELVHHLTGVR